jgi:ribosomal protein L30E
MTKTDSALEIIRNAQKADKLVIGLETTMNALKNDKLEYVFMANNAPQNMIDDVTHNGTVTETLASQVSINAEDLGVVCKKQFRVTIVGVLRK